MDSIQFYDITVGQYQLLNNIDKDLTEIEQNIYAVAAIKNITYDEASKIKLSEFNDMVKDIGKINLNKLEQKKVNNKIFLNGEEYHVEHRPDRLTSGQLLDILNIRANHQGESIQVMDLLIAALSRQKGKKYSEDNLTLTERAKYCRDVKVTDVWNVFVFFWNLWNGYLKNSEDYLQKWTENSVKMAREILDNDGDSSA
jgi:hypothetical protein